jgi:hypothetical protein
MYGIDFSLCTTVHVSSHTYDLSFLGHTGPNCRHFSLLDFMTDSAQPEPQTPQPDPRFLALVKQEHERLSNVYPTAEDVPGCVSLLDSFLLCNGAS